jgi:Recombinase zinc beta ribbon domain
MAVRAGVSQRLRRDLAGCATLTDHAHKGHPKTVVELHYMEADQHNLQILQSNGRGYEIARSSPPREGATLLQGRAVCGRCGRHFCARYAARRGRLDLWYVCDRAHSKDGETTCQTINGAPVKEGAPADPVLQLGG